MNIISEPSTRLNGRDLIMNTLNGLSIGIIVALVPGALLNQLLKALLPVFPQAAFFLTLTGMATVLMAPVSAVCVGMMAGFSPIQTSSLALAAIAGAGNFQLKGTSYVVAGSGDVINIAITIMIGYLIIALLGQALKAYTILLIPLLVLIIAGGIGVLTLKPVGAITQMIGLGIEQLTQLQPIVMGILIGMVFSILIVSPISSVGIAAAIGINGLAAGSANLGIVAASFALAVYGWKVNSVGTSLAHFLGSPKMQMANILSRPRLIFPVVLNAGIMGGLGALFGVSGTPMSAGFGFAGLIGPIAAINGYGNANILNIGLVTLLFFVIPIVLGLVSNYLFEAKFHYFDSQDFELNY